MTRTLATQNTTTVTMNDSHFLVEAGKVPQHDRFWSKVNRGVWEPETFRVIDAQTDLDTLVVDCGGWIGPTILYTAQRAGLCVGFEPDPVAYETLTANLALNADAPWAKNVVLYNQAIHSTGRQITIAAGNNVGGDSMTSVLNAATDASWKVKTRRLQDVIKKHRKKFAKVFVKIDVEGGEYDILPSIADTMADPDVSFLISFHHRRLKLAMAQEHDNQPSGEEAFLTTLKSVAEALPWGRDIKTLEGNPLIRERVFAAAGKGRAFGSDIVIR
ncbi:FkbM family methyltransferase [Sulfitobacter sp. HNIBRBA3233]|uniref:FkbM family methyltransferase n=1 Tax=Sulfitobacter marinivivus TaxID=3158558 RepID=UPI0032DE3B37